LVAAAAFGFIAGDVKRRFRVIEGLTNKDIIEARRLIKQKKIELSLKRDCTGLDIEVTILTDREKARVIILNTHLNIVSIEKIDLNSQFKPFLRKEQKANTFNHQIQKYTLENFLSFSDQIPLEKLSLLEDGLI